MAIILGKMGEEADLLLEWCSNGRLALNDPIATFRIIMHDGGYRYCTTYIKIVLNIRANLKLPSPVERPVTDRFRWAVGITVAIPGLSKSRSDFNK